MSKGTPMGRRPSEYRLRLLAMIHKGKVQQRYNMATAGSPRPCLFVAETTATAGDSAAVTAFIHSGWVERRPTSAGEDYQLTEQGRDVLRTWWPAYFSGSTCEYCDQPATHTVYVHVRNGRKVQQPEPHRVCAKHSAGGYEVDQ